MPKNHSTARPDESKSREELAQELTGLRGQLEAEKQRSEALVQELSGLKSSSAVSKADHRYRSLFDALQEGFFLGEVLRDEAGSPSDLRLLEANAAFGRLTGLDPKEIIGQTARHLFPDSEPHWIEAIKHVASTGEAQTLEAPMRALERWFEVYAYCPVPGQVAVLAIDRTGHHQAESTLKENESLYRSIARHFPDGAIYVFDHDLRFRVADGQAMASLGYSREALEGKTIWEATDAETCRILEERYPRVLAGESLHFETRLKGRVFSSDYVPIRDEQGKVVAGMVVSHDITERKRAEQALRESEEQYRTIVETAQEGIVIGAPDGRIQFVNQRMADMLGYPKEEIFGRVGLEFMAADQREKVIASRHKLKGGEPVQGEYKFLRKDGSVLWTLANSTPVHDSLGNHIANLAMHTDISTRKRAEQALQISQRDLARAQAVSHTGSWRLDLRSQRLDWSEETYRLFGIPLGTPISYERFLASVHPDDREFVLQQSMVARKGALYDIEHRIRVGDEVKWVREKAELEYDDSGVAVSEFGTVADITERKGAEKALQKSREDLTRAQAVARIGNWRSDTRSGEIEWSEENHRIFGVPKDTPMNHEAFLSIVHPEDRARVEQVWRAALRGEVRYDIEHRIVVGGEVRWVHELAELERGPQGRVRGAFGTTQDITRQKQLEEALQEAKEAAESASRTKSDFLAHMSHEIRTPLSAIIGLSEVLQPRILEEQNRQFMAMIRESAQSLLSLIGDILDFSRIEGGKAELQLKEFDLYALFEKQVSTFSVVAKQKGLSLTMHIREDVSRQVIGDAERLAQVLRNLLSNAVKYTEHGGVEITVARPAGAGDTGMIQVEVRDTGIGIPSGKLPKLFQPFTRLHSEVNLKSPEGTGLGLVISKRLVELMGGEIGMESKPGAGSTFRFTVSLPGADSPLSAPIGWQEKQYRYADALRGIAPLKILLVEDSRVNQVFLKTALEEAGHQVEVAENGREALEALKKQVFDLVLMDVQMPVMDGIEATRRIRKLKGKMAKTPVIALTAFAVKGDEERFLATGMDGYVSKPVDFTRLAEEIRRVCVSEPQDIKDTKH